MYKCEGVRFSDFQALINSSRPNYFIFKGYLKTEDGEGGSSEPPETPLDPPLKPVSVAKQSYLVPNREDRFSCDEAHI